MIARRTAAGGLSNWICLSISIIPLTAEPPARIRCSTDMARLLLLAAIVGTAGPDYTVELTSPAKLFDGKFSWAHPRAGTIPPRSRGNDTDTPIVVMTMQRIYLSG